MTKTICHIYQREGWMNYHFSINDEKRQHPCTFRKGNTCHVRHEGHFIPVYFRESHLDENGHVALTLSDSGEFFHRETQAQ